MTISTDERVETAHCHYCTELFKWSRCACEEGQHLTAVPYACPRCWATRMIVLECLRDVLRDGALGRIGPR